MAKAIKCFKKGLTYLKLFKNRIFGFSTLSFSSVHFFQTRKIVKFDKKIFIYLLLEFEIVSIFVTLMNKWQKIYVLLKWPLAQEQSVFILHNSLSFLWSRVHCVYTLLFHFCGFMITTFFFNRVKLYLFK